MNKIYFSLLLFLFSKAAFSQPVIDSTNLATPLQEVVISSFHINDSLMNAPASIAILSARQLQQNNNIDISQILNTVPGIFMQSGALNTNRFSIRGIGARTPYGTNKIRAFYGSIPLTSGDSETTIEDLNIENLSQAEIIKGPLSSVYGGGLGGAILLSPVNRSATGHTAGVSATHGSFGLVKTNFQYSGNFGSESLNINYHNIYADGWRQNSSYRREGVTLNGELFKTENSKLAYLFNHTYLKAFIPSSIDLTTFEKQPQNAAANWLAAKGFEQYDSFLGGLAYDFNLGKIRNSTSVFFNTRDSNEPRPFDILKQQTNGYGARTQFSADVNLGKMRTYFILGGEYFADGYDGQTFENRYQENDGNGSLQGNKLSDNSQERDFYNLFAQARFVLTPKFEVQTGVNVNQTSFKLENRSLESPSSETYSYDVIAAPQLSLLFKPSSEKTFYFSASRGFSLPAIEETLTENGTINSSIKPETGYNLEVGGKIYFLNRSLYAETSLFRMDVQDLLVAKRVGDDQYVGINTGKTRHQGIETSINYSKDIAKNLNLLVYVGAAIGKFEFVEFVDGDNDFSGNDLTGFPSQTLNAQIQLRYNKLYVSADFRSVDGYPINDANTVSTDSYSILNLKSGYRTKIGKNLTAAADVGINNVTNTGYASMVLVNATAFGQAAPRFYYPGLPVNYYGTISLAYDIERSRNKI
ncbi:MAG: TonB-dependent receptor [Flavobacterium sp.]|nr:TonB-dependent receptor [Flavobacterium sp.]